MFLLWVPQGTDAVEHQSDRTQNIAFECWRLSLKNTHCFLVPCSPAGNMFPAPWVMVRRLDQLPAPQSLWVSGDVALVPPWRSTGSTCSQGAETQGMWPQQIDGSRVPLCVLNMARYKGGRAGSWRSLTGEEEVSHLFLSLVQDRDCPSFL